MPEVTRVPAPVWMVAPTPQANERLLRVVPPVPERTRRLQRLGERLERLRNATA